MPASKKVMCIINPRSGKKGTDYTTHLIAYFHNKDSIRVSYHDLEEDVAPEELGMMIQGEQPDLLLAVGGDGTINLCAQALLNTNIPLGIVPAGSANGMARDLGIPMNPEEALDVALKGETIEIHAVKVNGKFCIHLADIGFNAFLIKKFKHRGIRGMWGYFRAALKALRQHSKMDVTVQSDSKTIHHRAVMVVLANASRYGTGAVINPRGDLEDRLFEVVVVRKLSIREIFKMMLTHKEYDPRKTILLHTSSLEISPVKPAHFQVDGEYYGKVDHVKAEIIPEAVKVVVNRERVGE